MFWAVFGPLRVSILIDERDVKYRTLHGWQKECKNVGSQLCWDDFFDLKIVVYCIGQLSRIFSIWSI